MEQQNLAPKDSSASVLKTEELKKKFDEQREKYDKLRADVAVKLKFLDENRVCVNRNIIIRAHVAYVYIRTCTCVLMSLINLLS